MPPMPIEPLMGEDPSMNDGMNGQMDGMDDPNAMGNEDDESDPNSEFKKEVGDISHSLQGDDIDQDDAKWALGMIIPQAKKKLDGSELKKMANKLTDVSDISDNSDGNGEPMDNEDPSMNGDAQQGTPMESRNYLKQRVTEIIGNLLDDDDAQKDREQHKITNHVQGSPFKTRFK